MQAAYDFYPRYNADEVNISDGFYAELYIKYQVRFLSSELQDYFAACTVKAIDLTASFSYN